MKKGLSLTALLISLCLIDLSAQKWDTLAPIPESFTFPVVALADGKIHIMGGGGTGGATTAHYAYDPTTDNWESRAAVPYRAQQPAGATANGKIHFFGGGFPNSGSPLNDHYMYDPATDSWQQAADLTRARAIHYAVTLDNVLYSLAGQGVANLCQTYNPVANAWTTKNNLPDNGFWYGAHVAAEGHIYRFCGGGYTAPNKLAHSYDPATDNWTALPAFPVATHGIKGAAIGNKIFLVGGYNNFEDRDEVWIFDTETLTYEAGLNLPLGRTYHNVVAIDSCIYVIGGNHAIDETVPLQLLRLCPFETSSGTTDKNISSDLDVRYYDGNIYFRTPEAVRGSARLAVFDISGRQVFSESLKIGDNLGWQVTTGKLIPAVYVVRLSTESGIFSGKIIAQ